MFFGKRKVQAAPAQPAAAPARPQSQETRQQVFPAEVWEGEMGDLLRQIGMSPDDESNLVPTGASIDARVARDRERHEAKLAEINRDLQRQVPGGRMLPFFLIPEPCWNGDMGTFFMVRLRFFPYDDWNVVFMPADERTAAALNAKLHPGYTLPGAVELVQSFVLESETKLDAARQAADLNRNFAAFGETLNSVRGEVWGIASYIANHVGAKWEPPKSWKP
jgi:hypothetical protein